MFLVKEGTTILIQAPKSTNHFNWFPWRPYTTKQDKFYDKHEVWDSVTVYNDRGDVPEWARHNIITCGKVVIQRDGKFALVNARDIEFLD